MSITSGLAGLLKTHFVSLPPGNKYIVKDEANWNIEIRHPATATVGEYRPLAAFLICNTLKA